MYFDAVVKKTTMEPVVNNTPEKVKAWVEEHKYDPSADDFLVCIGSSLKLVSFEEYLKS